MGRKCTPAYGVAEGRSTKTWQEAGASLPLNFPLRPPPSHPAVERVALDGLAAGFFDQRAKLLDAERLRGLRAGLVVD